MYPTCEMCIRDSPDIDGVEIIKKIRTWSNMPIIVISARSEDTDKIDALDAGASLITLRTMKNTKLYPTVLTNF